MLTLTSLYFFTAIFVALGGALAVEFMIVCRHFMTELYMLGFKVHTRAVSAVINNYIRSAPVRRSAWNVYVALADGAYCMHIQMFNHVTVLIQIFNKVAV